MKPCQNTPCRGCPMRRMALPGYLGNDTPEHFSETVHSDEHMPCHLTVDYTRGDDWRDQLLPGVLGSATECAGIAIYRANVNKRVRPFIAGPFRYELRTLRPNKRTVFANRDEFLAHHKRLTNATNRRR